jgi:hypothetical protein
MGYRARRPRLIERRGDLPVPNAASHKSWGDSGPDLCNKKAESNQGSGFGAAQRCLAWTKSRAIAPAIIELGGAGIAMAGRLLHVFELGAVFDRRGDEGKVARIEYAEVAAIEPEADRELAHHGVDGIGVHGATFLLAFAVGAQGPEQRAVEVGAVAGDRDRRAAAPRSAGWWRARRAGRPYAPPAAAASHSRGSAADCRPDEG